MVVSKLLVERTVLVTTGVTVPVAVKICVTETVVWVLTAVKLRPKPISLKKMI